MSQPQPPQFPWQQINVRESLFNQVPARVQEAHSFARFMAMRSQPLVAIDHLGNI